MRAIQTNIFPFAYFLAPDGVILSKGVVNNGLQMDMLVANGRTTKPVRTRVLSVG